MDGTTIDTTQMPVVWVKTQEDWVERHRTETATEGQPDPEYLLFLAEMEHR